MSQVDKGKITFTYPPHLELTSKIDKIRGRNLNRSEAIVKLLQYCINQRIETTCGILGIPVPVQIDLQTLDKDTNSTTSKAL